MRQQLIALQKKTQELERENKSLKEKLAEYENESKQLNGQRKKSEQSFDSSSNTTNNKSMSIPSLQPPPVKKAAQSPLSLLDEITDQTSHQQVPTVGTRLENLSFDDLDDFNPRAFDAPSNGNSTNGVHQPAASPTETSAGDRDVFGSEPWGEYTNLLTF